jgi:hypothetical protein
MCDYVEYKLTGRNIGQLLSTKLIGFSYGDSLGFHRCWFHLDIDMGADVQIILILSTVLFDSIIFY